MVCRNHANRTARRKCFLCKIPLCPGCQHKVYHHIFCGHRCAEAFAEKKNPKARDVSQRLEALDTGLVQDIRETGDLVVESVRKEFTRLEDELDQALTTLATMVEGSSVATGKDLEKTAQHLKAELTSLDRAFKRRWDSTSDHWQELKLLLLSTRSSLHEFQSKVEDLHEKNQEQQAKDRELKEKQFSRLQTHVENQHVETQREFSNLLKNVEEKFKEKIESQISAYEAQNQAYRTQREELKKFQQMELPALFEATQGHNDRRISALETKIITQSAEMKQVLEKHMQACLQDFYQQIHQHLSKTLGRVVDDIASLTVAQQGSWNEVILAAQKGAKLAGEGLREDLHHRLKDEVSTMARDQKRAIGLSVANVHKELIRKIRGKLSPWPRRLAYGALVTAAIVSLATSFVLTRKEQAQTAFIEKRLAEQDQSFREWLSEKLTQIQFAQATRRSRSKKILPTTTRGNTRRREVAFTFDGGSNARAASEILDLLKKKSIRSTMFLTGQFIQENPDLVKQIVREGHEVGNHLLKHDHLVDWKSKKTQLSKKEFLHQLKAVEKTFEAVTGRTMSRFWRAPYGEINKEIIEWASSHGYTHVGWTRNGRKSLDTLDWVADPKHPLYRSPKEIMNRILSFEKYDQHGLNGGIVLMHLGSERKPKDMPHRKLPDLIDRLVAKGYRGVTVSQALRTEVAKR